MAHPFFDVAIFPWRRPEARPLLEKLVAAFPAARTIDLLYKTAGGAPGDLALNIPPREIWQAALENLARIDGALRALCANIAADPNVNDDTRAAVMSVVNAAAGRSETVSPLPIVGRQEYLELCDAFLDPALSPAEALAARAAAGPQPPLLDQVATLLSPDAVPTGLVFYGLPGVGKTTLLNCLHARAADRDLAPVGLDFDRRTLRDYPDEILAAFEQALFRKARLTGAQQASYLQRVERSREVLEQVRVQVSQRSVAYPGASTLNSPPTGNVEVHEAAGEAAERERRAALAHTEMLVELARGVTGVWPVFIDHWDMLVERGTPEMAAWMGQDLLGGLRQAAPGLRLFIAAGQPVPETELDGILNLELLPLRFEAAQELMQEAGLTEPSRQQMIYGRTGGNPLLLKFGLLLWRQNRSLDLANLAEGISADAALEWLLTHILPNLNDERSRLALGRGSVLEYWNRDALAAVCARQDFDQQWYDDLLPQPFAVHEPGQRDIGALNRTVRETLIDLLWRNERQTFFDAHDCAHRFFEKRAETEVVR